MALSLLVSSIIAFAYPTRATTGFGSEGGVAEYVKLTSHPSPLVQVNLSEPLTLTCTAVGSPLPTILWYKDDWPLSQPAEQAGHAATLVTAHVAKPLGATVSQLYIPCLSLQDVGRYRCKAVAGGSVETGESLLVLEDYSDLSCASSVQSVPWIVSHSPSMMAPIGTDVILPCHVQGQGPVRFQWTDSEGNLLTNRPPTTPPPPFEPPHLDTSSALVIQLISHMALANQQMAHVVESSQRSSAAVAPGSLLLSQLTWEDMGLYTCTYSRGSMLHSLHTFLYPLMPDLGEDDSPAEDEAAFVDKLNRLPVSF